MTFVIIFAWHESLKWVVISTWYVGVYCFLGGSAVKNPPVMQETWQELKVQSLGWEDLLEKEMTTQYSILAWKIPWTEEPGGVTKQFNMT